MQNSNTVSSSIKVVGTSIYTNKNVAGYQLSESKRPSLKCKISESSAIIMLAYL